MCHTDGYVGGGVDVDVCDVDAAEGVDVVGAVYVVVAAAVGRIDADDVGI